MQDNALAWKLTIDLWLLDSVLTGRDPRSGRGDVDKLVVVDEFCSGREHYLSDGGYSRVVCHENCRLALTSNSLDEVKAKWPNHGVQQIVRRIERLLRDEIGA